MPARRALNREAVDIPRCVCAALNDWLALEESLRKLLADVDPVVQMKSALALQAMYDLLLCSQRSSLGGTETLASLKKAMEHTGSVAALTAVCFAVSTVSRYVEFYCKEKLFDLEGAIKSLQEQGGDPQWVETLQEYVRHVVSEQNEARTTDLLCCERSSQAVEAGTSNSPPANLAAPAL